MKHNKPLSQLLRTLGLEEAVFFRDGRNFHDSIPKELAKKLDHIAPDAIYFFNNIPFILFFDLTTTVSENRESDIHKQVWSFDSSPIVFILKESEIKIYNALHFRKEKGVKQLKEIELTEEERNKQFSFWNLSSGKTWTWFDENFLKGGAQKKRVNDKLFENIKDVRTKLISGVENSDEDISDNNNLSEDKANALILRLIFIRYLIDRDVEIDSQYIHGETLNERRLCFAELIPQKKNLQALFSLLNKRFNGILFKELDIELSDEQSKYLADVFKGEIQEEGTLFKGYFFFDIFDFSVIPVEVISGIYESLLNEETRKKDAAIYTPPFLVEYILDDTVEKHLSQSATSDCPVFEVAVGSGIFLVQSLRKMIDREIELNGNANKEEFSTKIRDIVRNNLFGVDINLEALKVACFSIYIALLDYQEPKDIKTYQFPKLLDDNLFHANFFDTEHEFNTIVKSKNIRFILGNPPWGNANKKDKDGKLTIDAITHNTYLKNNKLEKVVSDYQYTQSFILRTKDFSTQHTESALIVSSKTFYNNNASNFKERFLCDFYLNKCLDLSPVRRLIFKAADNPAMIVFFHYAHGKDTSNNIVKHYSLKHNIYTKNFNALVFEKHDIKRIKQEYFIQYKWMFKLALYGHALDFVFLKRITEYISLENFFSDNRIMVKNGIQRGTPKKVFDFLIGLPILEKGMLQQHYTPVENMNLPTVTEEMANLQNGGKIEAFQGKRILYGKRPQNETEIVISYVNSDCVFRDSTTAIVFQDDTPLLELVYCVLKSHLFTYYQFLANSSWGVYYPDIYQEELVSFPFSNEYENFRTNLNEIFQLIINNDVPETIWRKPLEEKINLMYSVRIYEEDLIDYAVNVSRYQFKEDKMNLITNFYNKDHRNQTFVLEQYADVFLKELKPIYDDEHIRVDIYILANFIAMNFVFLKEKPEQEINYCSNVSDEAEVLKRLARNLSISQITNTTDPTKNLYIQRDIKGFEKDSFYIIKPHEYKSWHRAMAWHDVAEIKDMIEDAEIKYLSLQ